MRGELADSGGVCSLPRGVLFLQEYIDNFYEHGYTRFEFLQGVTIKVREEN